MNMSMDPYLKRIKVHDFSMEVQMGPPGRAFLSDTRMAALVRVLRELNIGTIV